MIAIEHGGPAFPGSKQNEVMQGMSLRDYFAAKAVQGWLASYDGGMPHPVALGAQLNLAKQAYAVADAMLKARQP